ncbi:MAG: hypothetical protein ACXVAY_21000 [Mucilaginibacter sp.]
MDMQDNEFDKLFHSKLNDFEAEPSGRVWDEVSGELTSGKRKKVLISILSAAASIIVLTTVGMLYFPQKTRIDIKPPAGKGNVVKVRGMSHVDSIAENNNDQQEPEHKNVLVHQQNKAAVAVIRKPVLPKSQPKAIANVNPVEAVQPDQTAGRGDVLISMQPKENVPNLVTPVGGAMEIHPPVEEKLQVISKATLPTNQLSAVKKPDNTPLKPKKIRRLGDFLNFVVAKVDKRRDKIIEFASTDDDDDETRVSGVNLGIVKIKNDK